MSPTLDPIGVAPSPEELEPLEVPIVGAVVATGEPITITVRFRAILLGGSQMEILRAMDGQGRIAYGVVLDFVDSQVDPDSVDEWERVLRDRELAFEQDTIREVYRALTEFYGSRPTRPSSGSAPGRRSTSPTSRGASRARATAKTGSGRSPSRSRST